MGRNARDRARRRRLGPRVAQPVLVADPVELGRAMNRQFRPSCPSCGFRVLAWLGLVDAIERCGREWVADLLAETGWPGDSLEVWLCSRCGDRGAFGPAEVA